MCSRLWGPSPTPLSWDASHTLLHSRQSTFFHAIHLLLLNALAWNMTYLGYHFPHKNLSANSNQANQLSLLSAFSPHLYLASF